MNGKVNELDKLIKFNETSIILDDSFNQTMHGCGLLWTYFPHWVSVKCGDDTSSILDKWEDDDKLKLLIRKTYNWQLKHGNGIFTVNRLRQNAKVYLNKQSVSNFRPSVAKCIYNLYGNTGTVWDMSGGWGGRLFGFLASNCEEYIATEPSSLSHEGLLNLANDYAYRNKKVTIHKCGSEDFIPTENSLDLCFTSPPYFDTEKYADESSQSYSKYPTKDSWLNGFLSKTIQNCYFGLKHGGKLIINISNTPKYNFLESETIRIAEENGFKLVETRFLILSSISGKGIKREPIFVFVK
jgi:hypothetical protein